jgi:hypothetical protein
VTRLIGIIILVLTLGIAYAQGPVPQMNDMGAGDPHPYVYLDCGDGITCPCDDDTLTCQILLSPTPVATVSETPTPTSTATLPPMDCPANHYDGTINEPIAGPGQPTPTCKPAVTPIPTRTPPFPVNVSDSSAGTADAVGVTRVNILGGTSTTTSCVQSGSDANCTINASSEIGSSFDLNVEINGVDSASCGAINAPCASVSGANGAFAKILANNDNAFNTCSDDLSQGCGRCTDSTLGACSIDANCSGGEKCIDSKCQDICNENSDCASSNAICSYSTCSNNNDEACGWSCSSTVARKCLADWDCPPSETCNSTNAASTCSSQSGGVCLGGANSGASCTVLSQCPGGTCLLCNAYNANSRCASGACTGSRKSYTVNVGAGSWTECWNGSTQIPSPGLIDVKGKGRSATNVTCWQDGTTAFDLSNRVGAHLQSIGLGVVGNSNTAGTAGNSSGCWIHDSGLTTVGIGWPLTVTGHGNATVGASNIWVFGLTNIDTAPWGAGKGVRIESWPNKVCEESNPDQPCDDAADCGGGSCVSLICSNNNATVCNNDADCSGGGKCQGSIDQWVYGVAKSSVGSADLVLDRSWIQPGGGGGNYDGACYLHHAAACGNSFNVIVADNTFQVSDDGADRAAGSTGLKIDQTCSDTTAIGKRNKFLLQARNITINNTIVSTSSKIDRSLDIDEGTTLAISGPFVYDPTRRYIKPARSIHDVGKILFLDATNDRWGGGFSGIQSINANEPRSQPLGQNGTPFFGYGTSGSCNASSTAYCYKITGKNELGEGQPSTGACASTPSGSNNKNINVAWEPIPYATSFNIYRSTTLGGTYTKICDCASCPACPTSAVVGEIAGTVLAGYTDTCVGTPSGSIPSTGGPNNDGDSSWNYNSVPGEVWYSETLDSLRANINGTVRTVTTMETDVESCALTSGTCVTNVGTNITVFPSDLEAWTNTGRRSLIRAGFQLRSVASTRDWTCSLRDNGTPVVTRNEDNLDAASYATLTLEYVEDGSGTQGPYNVVCSASAGTNGEVSAAVMTRETL